MRTFIMLILWFSVCQLSVSAQSKQIDVGLQGGINQIYYEKDNRRGESNKEFVGYGGIVVRYDLNKFLNFRSGIIYERKGGTNTGEIKTPANPDGTGKMYNVEIYFDYLTLPLLGEYKFWSDLPVYIVAGPYMGVPINIHHENTLFDLSDEHEPRPQQIGIMGGVGAEFSIYHSLSVKVELSHKRS